MNYNTKGESMPNWVIYTLFGLFAASIWAAAAVSVYLEAKHSSQYEDEWPNEVDDQYRGA